MNLETKIKRLSYIKEVIDNVIDKEIETLSEESNLIFEKIEVCWRKSVKSCWSFAIYYKGFADNCESREQRTDFETSDIEKHGFKNPQDFVDELSEALNENLQDKNKNYSCPEIDRMIEAMDNLNTAWSEFNSRRNK